MKGRWNSLIARIAKSGPGGFIAVVGGTLGLALSLNEIYGLLITDSFGHDSVLWAGTVSALIALLGIVIFICSTNNQVQNDEIRDLGRRIIEHEEAILQKRRSSK